MGLFRVEIQVASYLALPGSLLTSLGYRPIDRQRVVFATGEAAVWDVAEVKVRLQGRERTVGLGVDPLGKRLVPVDAYLA